MTSKLLSAFFVLSLTLSGCSGKKDGDKSGDKKDGDTGPKALGKAEFTLSSQDFGQEFKGAAGTDARKKYQNKVVELTGTLVRIGLSPDRQPILWLEGAKGEPVGVHCMSVSKEPWKKALPGQTVTVKGKGAESGLGAALAECEIVSTKDDAPEMLTPDKLAEEHAKDLDATIKKYDQKMLAVEGEIAKVETNQSGHPEITLKTAKETPRVYLNFTDVERKRVKDLKAGQKVKALGAFTALNVDKEIIGLYDAIIIEPAP